MNCHYTANIKVKKSLKRAFFNLYIHFRSLKRLKTVLSLYCILATIFIGLKDKKQTLTKQIKSREPDLAPHSFI